MLSNESGAPRAFINGLATSEMGRAKSRPLENDATRGRGQVFTAFDEFLDRMPAWIFHTLGVVTALVALWFALAFLRGFPGSVVEWIALAMFGAFAYAIGFMIPLVATYLYQSAGRILMAFIVIGGGAALGAVALPLPA